MIVFRADLSLQTGLRTLRRCAYLATLLKKTNRVLLCSREDKKTEKFLAEKGVPFALGKDPGALDLAGVKAVVFDVGDFSSQDAIFLERAKKAGIPTIQLAAGGAPAPVDIVVDSSPSPREKNAAESGSLAGPAYALLHHKFRHFNKVKRKYRKRPSLILINLGDPLPYRELRDIIDALHRLRFRLKIVPGANMKKADKRNLMRIYPGIHFCGKSESPARAYFEADLALIPPGEEALEAACAGTPALYMPLAKGQEALAAAWAGMEIGVKIPCLADLTVSIIRDALAPLTQERRQQMGTTGKALVDGLGVQRFLKVLKEKGIIA
jgi:spore coat polysaccharide biosynthesis predicted glycosyltransferase SpsG